MGQLYPNGPVPSTDNDSPSTLRKKAQFFPHDATDPPPASPGAGAPAFTNGRAPGAPACSTILDRPADARLGGPQP